MPCDFLKRLKKIFWMFLKKRSRFSEAPVEAPPLVKMYDAAILDGPFKEFIELSAKIGGDVDSVVSIKFFEGLYRNRLYDLFLSGCFNERCLSSATGVFMESGRYAKAKRYGISESSEADVG